MDIEQMSTHEIVLELMERITKTNGIEFVPDVPLLQLAQMLAAEMRARAENGANGTKR